MLFSKISKSFVLQVNTKHWLLQISPKLSLWSGGCALLTHEGLLISGSEISADRPSEGSGGSISRISPLQCALVSLGANGLCPTKVMSVAYLGEVWPEDEMLKAEVTLWSGEVFFVSRLGTLDKFGGNSLHIHTYTYVLVDETWLVM